MQNLIHDWKTTLRKHRRSLGTFVTSVLILGVAAGTNAAIYALADSFYLGTASGRHGDVYLVGATPTDPEENYFYMFNARLLDPIEESLTSFQSIARVSSYDLTLSNLENPRRLVGLRVGEGAPRVLRIDAVRGRPFQPSDFEPGAEKVLLLGHHLWVSEMGASDDAIGRVLRVNGTPHRVIGVLPPDFTFKHERYDVATPSSFTEPVFLGAGANTWLAGALKPGVTHEQARAEAKRLQAAFADRVRPQYFEENALDVRAVNTRSNTKVETQITLLLATGTILLVIAAANLCSIALLKLGERRAEYAARLALGASRWHIARLFALENSTVIVCGYLLALLLGWALVRLITTQFAGADWGVIAILGEQLRVSWRILAYTFAACVAVLALLSLTTLALSSSGLLATLLREDGRGLTDSKAFRRIAHLLRFLQVAATCVALVLGGFFLLSMHRVSEYDYGYRFERIVRTEVQLPTHRFVGEDGELGDDAAARLSAMMASVADAVRQVPRVSDVTVSKLEFPHWGETRGVRLAGTPPDTEEENLPQAKEGFVGPGFFEMVGMRRVRGELFSPIHDRRDGEMVVVVNQAFAERYLRGADPVNQMIEASGVRARVIGVVGNVRRWQQESGRAHGLPLEEQAEPAYYFPSAYSFVASRGYLYMRIPDHDARAEREVRAAIRRIDPDIVVSEFGGLRALLDQRDSTYRFIVFIEAFVALVVALLVSVAVYSAVSHAVAQRRREIGIRMALGAPPAAVGRSIYSYALMLAVPGTVAGLALAWVGLVRVGLLRTQLHLVDVADPWIYLAGGAGLVAVALAAATRPALRAAGTIPNDALRQTH